MRVKKTLLLCAVLVGSCGLVDPSSAEATVLYSNGFEVNTTDWANTNRVPSGTNSITSASGGYHAEKANGSTYTLWGGYNYGAGGGVATTFQEYVTSIDIYLNVGGGWTNDTRFDFSSAINNAAGNHLRDFIFNAGFYNDATGPGANTNRFVISASNNTQPGSAYAKNPDKSPIAISTTGWYTFEHHFKNVGGVLSVEMSISDSLNVPVNTWTLNTADLITNVGGNRYGWFDYNQFSVLAFDNASLKTISSAVPLPAAAWGGIALLGSLLGAKGLKRMRRQA